jgi:hypothetical protein
MAKLIVGLRSETGSVTDPEDDADLEVLRAI